MLHANGVLFNNLKPISRQGILRCRIRAVYLLKQIWKGAKDATSPTGGREGALKRISHPKMNSIPVLLEPLPRAYPSVLA